MDINKQGRFNYWVSGFCGGYFLMAAILGNWFVSFLIIISLILSILNIYLGNRLNK